MSVENIPVKGLRELGVRFAKLGVDLQDKGARAATGSMAQVIKKIMKAKAPVAAHDYVVRNNKGDPGVQVSKGNIAKNIISKKLPKGRTALTSEHIVTIRSKRKDGYASRIASLYEFGTVKQQPRPFMRPSIDQGKGQAIQACKNELTKFISKQGA